MFPIRDHNPSGRTPYVVYALIAANVLVFLYQLPMMETRELFRFYDAWAMVPVEISNGVDLHTLVTSQFLHGGFMHIAGNMLFLWIFGDNMEDEMGHLGFLAFYLGCGVLAALAQWAAAPMDRVPMVGASGAIAGVMGGYLLMFPKAEVDVLIFFRVVQLRAWVMLGLWFAFQIGNGAVDMDGTGGVAYWAHAGGFVVGALASLPIWLMRGGTGFWSRNDGHPPHPELPLIRSGVPKVPRRR